jgi:hypothetical protein
LITQLACSSYLPGQNSQPLVAARIEAVQEAQLELVRAFEEVLELAERQRDFDLLHVRFGLDGRRCRQIRLAGEGIAGRGESAQEWRRVVVAAVPFRRPGAEEVVLAARQRDIEQPSLVLDRTEIAVGADNRVPGELRDTTGARPGVSPETGS